MPAVRRRRRAAARPASASSATPNPAARAVSPPSQAPTVTQRRPVHGRGAARERGRVVPAGGLERGPARRGALGGEPARPRSAPAAAEAHPRRSAGRDAHTPRAQHGAAAVGLVVGVGPQPVARARVEVGGVRAVGQVDDEAPVAALEVARAAALGAGVLGVDGLGAVRAVLDELPVARVAPAAEDAAVLGVVVEPEPVLDPVARRAARRPRGAPARPVWRWRGGLPRPRGRAPEGRRRRRKRRCSRRGGRCQETARSGRIARLTCLVFCLVALGPARPWCANVCAPGAW